MFKMRERGIQSLNNRGRGDQLVRVIVDVPRDLNEEQKRLLLELDKALGNETAHIGKNEDEKKGFFGKKKK